MRSGIDYPIDNPLQLTKSGYQYLVLNFRASYNCFKLAKALRAKIFFNWTGLIRQENYADS